MTAQHLGSEPLAEAIEAEEGLTALYRLYDADGVLLYAGISMNVAQRWKKHSQRKPWWWDVAAATIERFHSRREARAAELAAIQTEAPLWNLQHRRSEFDRANLRQLGDRRRAVIEELAAVRREVEIEIPFARAAGITWRDISYDTTYTEQQLRAMTLPDDQKAAKDEERRKRRRVPPGKGRSR